MNLYRISQRENCGYDTYDSAVVAAESEDAARMIHPSKWADIQDGWDRSTWASPLKVKVELIGKAVEGTEAGVICASFNAG